MLWQESKQAEGAPGFSPYVRWFKGRIRLKLTQINVHIHPDLSLAADMLARVSGRHPSTHHAGQGPVALDDALRFLVAGAELPIGAAPFGPAPAAGNLVPHEARLARPAFVRALWVCGERCVGLVNQIAPCPAWCSFPPLESVETCR